MILFPADLDDFENPEPADSLDDPSHAGQHDDANDAIEALEAKVGVDNSTDEDSFDFRIRRLESNPHWITDFGAVGDGVTDDTAAIQAALDAGNADGRGVYVPKVDDPLTDFYKITDDLVPYSDTHMFGDGASLSIIKQTALNKNGLRGIGLENVTLHDFALKGNAADDTHVGTGTGKGIYLTYGTRGNNPRHELRNLNVAGWGSDGVYVQTGITMLVDNVLSQYNAGHGFHWPEGGTSTRFSNTWALRCNQAGYYFNQSVYISLIGAATDFCGVGYYIKDAQSIGFFACGSENQRNIGGTYNGRSWVIDNSANITLEACWITGNNNIGVEVINTANNAWLNVVDNSPGGSAVNFIKTAAGTNSVIAGLNNDTANSLSPGTVSIYNDGGGGLRPASDIHLANNKSIVWRNAADSADKVVLFVGADDVTGIKSGGGGLQLKRSDNVAIVSIEEGSDLTRFLGDLYLTNNKSLVWRNAADSADKVLLHLGTTDNVVLRGAGGDVFIEKADTTIIAQFKESDNTLDMRSHKIVAVANPTNPQDATTKDYTDSTFQVIDPQLTALAALSPAADKLPYFTGATTAALADFTTLARTLIANSTEANMRTTLQLGSANAVGFKSLALTDTSGTLSMTAAADGGEYNLSVSASGTLALFGSGGNFLNLELLDGGLFIDSGKLVKQTSSPPASAGATGGVGTIEWDSGFIYICVAANTWKRVAIATW